MKQCSCKGKAEYIQMVPKGNGDWLKQYKCSKCGKLWTEELTWQEKEMYD